VYVCVCNAYRESHVRDIIRQTSGETAVTPEEIYAKLGSNPRCGRCLVQVKNMIESRTEEARQSNLASARV
jgi:bacterioferritin-associated ferredoxin